MHTAALAELGLAPDWTYEAIDVPAERFADLVGSLPARGFVGVNVTVPHKLAALALANESSAAATAIGAANTLSFDAEGTVRADNTDATGIIAALPASPGSSRALVLGAGGSARAAIWALREAGAEVAVWNRTAAKARDLADEFGVAHAERLPEFDLLVNATTIGMEAPGGRGEGSASEWEAADLKALPVKADDLNMDQTVVDLAYGPRESALIALARRAGAKTVDGLEVLIHQGAATLEIWTQRSAPLAAMRRAARAA